MVLKAINPATEALIREYPEHTDAEVEKRLTATRAAALTWRDVSMDERAALMRRLGEQLRKQRDALAALMVAEMGKPIASAESEVDKCALCCDYFAQNAAVMLAPQHRVVDADESYVRFDPLGVVLAIMPWNFPIWQVIRFAAPNLMAGNVGVLKHAPNVPGTALAIEKLFADAGFPTGVFSALLIANERAQGVIEHPAVAAVTLTGSVKAGGIVAGQAGAMRKKTVLELGGSDPFIVLADADLEAAAATAAKSRCLNSGQSCIAAKRFIVEAAIADAFVEALVAQMNAMKTGDPTDRQTDIGPLARADLRDTLEGQVADSIRAGAKLLAGGKRVGERGFFYAPTVLGEVTPGMRAFDEETFGPVAAVVRARDARHAVELANRSHYGLGANIWTRDLARAKALAEKIESGCIFINDFVKSDPALPFGGIKDSGYGRELGDFGIREFVNIKTVVVKSSDP